MHICDAHFGNTHHKSNQANAFRHALWNVLICQKTMKCAKNKQKSVFWTQKVGDLYEKVTQNELLDEAMDLHNNTIGRIFFLNHIDKNEEEMIHLLQKMAKKAQKVAEIEEINYFKNALVFLEE
jgi:CelD/BcsL family acetyltransferase involved in cellulose biosynthesis